MLELSSRDLKGLRTLSRKKASYLFSCLSFLIAILFFVLVFSGDRGDGMGRLFGGVLHLSEING